MASSLRKDAICTFNNLAQQAKGILNGKERVRILIGPLMDRDWTHRAATAITSAAWLTTAMVSRLNQSSRST